MGCGSSKQDVAPPPKPADPIPAKQAEPAAPPPAPAAASARAPAPAAPTKADAPAQAQAGPNGNAPARTPSAGSDKNPPPPQEPKKEESPPPQEPKKEEPPAPTNAASSGGGAAPAGAGAVPAGESEFELAMKQLASMPHSMREEVYRMLSTSEDTIENLINLTRIIRVQCLIRSFIARRRVAKIRQAKLSDKSEYEQAMEALEKLPPRIADQVREQMKKVDRPVHVIVKWAAIIFAQAIIRAFLARRRVKRIRKDKAAGAAAA